MFCTNCGKQLVDGAYACPYCGNVVDSAIKATPTEQPSIQTEPIAQPEQPIAQPEPAQAPEAAAPQSQPQPAPAQQQPYNPYTQPQYNPYVQPQYNPYAQPQQAPQEPPKPVRTHPLTIIGFVLAFMEPIVGLILCIIAGNKMKKDPSIAGGRGLNKAGLILSIVGCAVYVFLFFVGFMSAIYGNNGYLSLIFNII